MMGVRATETFSADRIGRTRWLCMRQLVDVWNCESRGWLSRTKTIGHHGMITDLRKLTSARGMWVCYASLAGEISPVSKRSRTAARDQ